MSESNSSGETLKPESLNNSSSTNSSSSTGSTSSSSSGSGSSSGSSNSSSNTNSSSNSSSNTNSSSNNNTPPPPPKKNKTAKKSKTAAKANKGKSQKTTNKGKPKKKVTIVEGMNKTAALQARRAQALKNLTAALEKKARVGNAATLTSMRNKGASLEEQQAFIEKVRRGETFKVQKPGKSAKKEKAEKTNKSAKKNKAGKKNKTARVNQSSKKNKSMKKGKKAKELLQTQKPANNATTAAATKGEGPSDKFKALMERRAKALSNLSTRFAGTGVKAKVGNAATLTALRNKGASEEEQEEFIQRALRGETMKPTGKKKGLTAIAEVNEEAPTATAITTAINQASMAAQQVEKQLKSAKKTSRKATAALDKEKKAVEDLARKEADRVAKENKARRLVELETQAATNLRNATGKNAKKSNTRKLAALRNSGLDFSVQEYLKMKAAIRTLKNRGFRNGSGIVEGPGGKKFLCENCKAVPESKTQVVEQKADSAEVQAASAQTNPLAEGLTSDEIIEALDE